MPPKKITNKKKDDTATEKKKTNENVLKYIQRYHLVLDLDGTLVASSGSMATYSKLMKSLDTHPNQEVVKKIKERIYVFDLGYMKMWTILRPGTKEFIDFIVNYFKVISVWSAGQQDYVEAIVDILFPPHMPKPAIVFTWDDCARDRSPLPSSTSEKERKAVCAASPSNPNEVNEFYKPLVELARHHSRKESEPLKRMLILDDRDDIAKYNPDNLILIPRYEPTFTLNELIKEDNAFNEFASWLMRPCVIMEEDVRNLDKSHIFASE